MGFNKRYLPELVDLKEIREEYGNDKKFLETYLYKPDAIIGSTDSMDYVRLIEKEYEKRKNEKESHQG